jgi:aminobenzoyl-glutamate transport protein
MADAPSHRRATDRALDALEALGNRLPDPGTMFVLLAIAVVVVSAIASQAGLVVPHPKDGELIRPVNLLTAEGVRRMLTEAVKNFTGFAPLGVVIVAMLGIGVAEGSGLIAAAMRAFVFAVPRTLLSAALVFAGVNANIAADAGLVVLPPIAAMLFAAAGRHPLAGVAAAFAGVAGGFSANLLPSSLDALLAGLTQEAVHASRLLPEYRVQILGNYWFLVVATPLLTVVGTWITDRIVEPRLGPWKGGATGHAEPLSAAERRGLVWAGAAAVATLALFATLVVPAGSPLRGPGGTLLEQLKPFFESIVVLIFVVFFVPGIVYGIAMGAVRSDRDVMTMTTETMKTMASYIVLAFFIAQFVNYFAWSNLGAILAISGANTLKAIGLQDAPLLVGLVLLSASINLLITSASAKWAVLAPVFVPMFVLLGWTPEGTQAVFRVGDSCTNIVTPLFAYMPFIIATVRKYEPRAGAGTIISMMVPYSIAFLVLWTLLLLAFDLFRWPIGPGVYMRLPQ